MLPLTATRNERLFASHLLKLLAIVPNVEWHRETLICLSAGARISSKEADGASLKGTTFRIFSAGFLLSEVPQLFCISSRLGDS